MPIVSISNPGRTPWRSHAMPCHAHDGVVVRLYQARGCNLWKHYGGFAPLTDRKSQTSKTLACSELAEKKRKEKKAQATGQERPVALVHPEVGTAGAGDGDHGTTKKLGRFHLVFPVPVS